MSVRETVCATSMGEPLRAGGKIALLRGTRHGRTGVLSMVAGLDQLIVGTDRAMSMQISD